MSAVISVPSPSECADMLGYYARAGDYAQLAAMLHLASNLTAPLLLGHGTTNDGSFDVKRYQTALVTARVPKPWDSILRGHYAVIGALSTGDVALGIKYQMELTSTFLSHLSGSKGVLLPVLMTLLENLGQLALAADLEARTANRPAEFLNRTMQPFQQAFAICVTDHSSSRPTHQRSNLPGALRVVNLQLRLFFHAGAATLIDKLFKTVQHRLTTQPEMVSASAKRDVLAFRFWQARYCVLDDRVQEAYEWIEHVLATAPGGCTNQLRWTLLFHVPLAVVTQGKLPSQRLLQKYPALQSLYGPLVSAIRSGSLADFDVHMAQPNTRAALDRLALEDVVSAMRWLVLRRAVKKLHVMLVEHAASGAAVTQVPFARVQMALGLSTRGGSLAMPSMATEQEEEGVTAAASEAALSSLIAMGMIKGYVSHEHQMLVLSKADPFPRCVDQVVRAMELWSVWRARA
ncbi:hypothetical protein BC828DRAFT_407750 [Blastocladiella britannica]|nr:hypothetical protein BC828DRAFT_407750 [Blastocladiella britannica]